MTELDGANNINQEPISWEDVLDGLVPMDTLELSPDNQLVYLKERGSLIITPIGGALEPSKVFPGEYKPRVTVDSQEEAGGNTTRLMEGLLLGTSLRRNGTNIVPCVSPSGSELGHIVIETDSTDNLARMHVFGAGVSQWTNF